MILRRSSPWALWGPIALASVLGGTVPNGDFSPRSYVETPAAYTTGHDSSYPAATGGPEDCASCHGEIHKEWKGSRHATAFTNEVYQKALKDLRHPERCHGCHAPKPVLDRLGRPPEVRGEDTVHGVHCSSCHLDRGTRIAGPFGSDTEDHESLRHPAFEPRGTTALCGSCHDLRIGPVLPLARDFREAGLRAKGESCTGCHMPEITRVVGDGGPDRKGRKHVLLGPSDREFAASAFDTDIQRERKGFLELRIQNRAGHRVPGLTTRKFVFEVRQGKQVDRVTISAENLLRVGELRRFPIRRTSGQAAELVVFHEHGGESVEIERRRFPF